MTVDRGAAAHLAADRGGDAVHLAVDPDAELLGVVVAAIAFVDVNAAGLDPGQRLQLGDHRPQSVAIKGIAVQRLGVQHKLTAFGLGGRRHHRDPCFRRGRLLQPNSYGARALPLPMHVSRGPAEKA